MKTIKIGGAEIPIEQADESWINQQINRRRADGIPVCVQVNIVEGDVNMTLRTPTCGNGGSGGRKPNTHELHIFELWDQRGLNRSDFAGGNVVAFLHQLPRFL